MGRARLADGPQRARGKGAVSTSLWPQEAEADRNSSRFPEAQIRGFLIMGPGSLRGLPGDQGSFPHPPSFPTGLPLPSASYTESLCVLSLGEKCLLLKNWKRVLGLWIDQIQGQGQEPGLRGWTSPLWDPWEPAPSPNHWRRWGPVSGVTPQNQGAAPERAWPAAPLQEGLPTSEQEECEDKSQ